MKIKQKFEAAKKGEPRERSKRILGIGLRPLKMDNPQRIFQTLVTCFQPEEELEQVKKRMNVKRASLCEKQPRIRKDLMKEFKEKLMKEFKEKLLTQKIGIAKIQVELEKFIRQNPDLTSREIYRVVSKRTREYRLNAEQVEEFSEAIEGYVEKHKEIQILIKNYKEKFAENRQPELFKGMFGEYPKGKVELMVKPMALFWRCWNQKDFLLPVDDKETRKLIIEGEWWGYNIDGKTLLGLGRLVNMQDMTKKPSKREIKEATDHEELHSQMDIRPVVGSERRFFVLASRKLRGVRPESSIETVRAGISDEVALQIEFFKTKAKDEIRAFLKTGDKVEDIKSTLINKYDYFKICGLEKELKERLVNQCGCAYESMVETVIKSYQRIYKKTLLRAFMALAELDKFFSGRRDELIALLSQESLTKWSRLARLIREIESS